MLLALSTTLPAQSRPFGLDPAKPISQYVHNSWTIDEGLPQNSVMSIAQGKDGYLWMGTEAGLVRFDGVAFTTFNSTNSPGLIDNYVNAVLVDRADTVWAGTWVGGVTRVSGGKSRIAPGAARSRVNYLFQDHAGTIWSAGDVGLARWRGGQFEAVPGLEIRVNVIAEAADRSLLIGTDSGLFALRNGRIARWQPPGGRIQESVWTILLDRQGGLWFGTPTTLYHSAQGKLRRYSREDGLHDGGVGAILQTRNGRIWVGVDGGGIARVAGERLEPFTARDGLSDDAVTSLLEDHEGSLWVGTRHGGLNRFREPVLAIFTTREGLPSNIVWSVYGDSSRDLWVGTSQGLAVMRAGHLTSYDTRDGLPGRAVYATLKTTDGSLWAATNRGLARLVNGRWQALPEPFPKSHVTALLEDRAGALWIGGYSGLYRWQSGKLHDYTREAGLTHVQVTSILEDPDGSLWIGSHGRGVLHLKDGRFTGTTTREGLSNDVVEALYRDKHGLWLGTQGGLNLLKDGHIAVLPIASPVYMTDIYQILEDDRGDLWLSSNEGLARVSMGALLAAAAGNHAPVEALQVVPLDGPRRIEFNGASQNAGWKTPDGRLWFPSIKGLVVVDPAHLANNRLPPPVHIESLLVDGKAVSPADNLVLPSGGGGLEFHYTATSLLIPERVNFRYRLDGYDKDWVDAGTRRVAYYTHVPGGHYGFHVIAANNDGVWNEAGAEMGFSLGRHFYETAWFYVLLSLALAAAVMGIFRLRVRRMRQHAHDLATLVEERTSQLQLEVSERRLVEDRLRQAEKMEAVGQLAGGIAHDLNNVLTAVLAHVDLAVSALPPGNALVGDLTLAQSAAHRGAGMIRKLLGFSRRDRLVLKPLLLPPLITELTATLRRVLPDEIEISLTHDADLPPVAVDPGAVQQMFLNLATNSDDAMPAGGRLHIHISLATPADALMATQDKGTPGNYVVLLVSDNGIGMDASTKDRIFEPYFSTKPPEHGSGLGMAMLYGIMKQHRGHVLVDSTPGAGTDVRLYFPVSTEPVPVSVPEVPPAANTGSHTILVVEDQEAVRGAAVRALTRYGYRVLSAVDGEEGLQLWRADADAIDLVFSDAIMPRMGGLALFEAMSAERPGIRFLLTSGYTGEEVNADGSAIADLPFLAKPWTIKELVAAVGDVLKSA